MLRNSRRIAIRPGGRDDRATITGEDSQSQGERDQVGAKETYHSQQK
jgi:hypothetical protein